ncbi:MAG: DUF4349 domain-containing protein [Gemmataceae bacterium]|nr:DUF4349 domain-containing protein [Gemmataceae bacterium]
MYLFRSLSVIAPLLLFALGPAGCAKSEVREAKKEERGGKQAADKGLDGQARDEQAGGEGKVGQALERKIIYTAQIRLITEEFPKARDQLLQLVEDHKGYVIHSEDRGAPGAPRYGEWKIRVPVAQFKTFREAVVKLGELQSSNLDSQDVTEEFYDLQARIKNREAREEALRQMYKDWSKKAEKPADLMPIKTELDQIRLEIEREQGRLKLLTRLTEMTTVTVIIYERGAYVPPETATLGTKASRTFSDSLGALGDLGQGLLLALIALTPWLPVIVLIVAPIWILARRARQAAASVPTAKVVEPSRPAAPPPQPS